MYKYLKINVLLYVKIFEAKFFFSFSLMELYAKYFTIYAIHIMSNLYSFKLT